MVKKTSTKERFSQAKAMSEAGIKPGMMAKILGVSPVTISNYRRFETYEEYRDYWRVTKQKQREKTAAREDIEKALEVTIDESHWDEPVAVEEPKNEQACEPQRVYDPIARNLVIELQQAVDELTERLAWLEGNAVIDTSHKNRIKFFGRK